MSRTRLLADVGGTNVRFALASPTGELKGMQRHPVDDFTSFNDALNFYLDNVGSPTNLDACAMAAAGPVRDGVVDLTNHSWTIDRDEVAELLGGIPVTLVNDLEAVAAALPYLTANDLATIGEVAPTRPELRTMFALNVGTGFGGASIIHRGGKWWSCPGEPGHMSLGAWDVAEIDMLPGNSTIESVLSGDGIVALYRRFAEDLGLAIATAKSAADVFAGNGRDAAASAAIDLVTKFLGRVAGDLVLATGAWGGIYFSGSVAQGWSTVADPKTFRAEFVRKGPMRALMQQVPAAIIRREYVSLFGLAVIEY